MVKKNYIIICIAEMATLPIQTILLPDLLNFKIIHLISTQICSPDPNFSGSAKKIRIWNTGDLQARQSWVPIFTFFSNIVVVVVDVVDVDFVVVVVCRLCYHLPSLPKKKKKIKIMNLLV